MRGRASAVIGACALTVFGLACTESRAPGRADGPARPASAAAASTPSAPASDAPAAGAAAPITKAVTTRFQRRRKKKRMDEIRRNLPKPPPRPEGEPKSPADLKKLSDAAAGGTPVNKPGAPPIERISDTQLRVGRMLVDRARRRLEVPIKVNMIQGILEYFGVASNGKLHESVIEMGIEPSHLHLGLILLGVEQIKYDYGDYKKPPVIVQPGGRLKLTVKYVDPRTKKVREHNAEDWLYNRKLKGPPKSLAWTFQGSTFWQNRYGADMDRSVITLINDQIAVIGTTDTAGNPYQDAALGFEVNQKTIPPKGTPATLIIEVLGDGKTPPK